MIVRKHCDLSHPHFQALKDVVINMDGVLEEEKLSLGPQVESTKVVNPANEYRSYTQQILYDGRPLVIRTEHLLCSDQT